MFRAINQLYLEAANNTNKKKGFFRRLNELDNLCADKIEKFNNALIKWDKEELTPYLDSLVKKAEEYRKETERELHLGSYRRVNKIMKEKSMNLQEALQYYNDKVVPGINEILKSVDSKNMVNKITEEEYYKAKFIDDACSRYMK